MWCWSINRQNRKYSSVVRLRKSFKALCKATLHPKKVKVNVWWSAMGLIHYSFLNPSKTITSEKYAQQINEMHWKLQCLQLALVNKMGPVLLQDNAWLQSMSHKQHFKSWTDWATTFDSSAIFTYPLVNWLPLLQASQLFAGKMLPQSAGSRKCFPRVH